MRFKQSNGNDDGMPKWLAVTLIVVSFPFWGALVAMLWIEEWSRIVKRKWFGPRVGEWQRWFAWRPVTLENGWGDVVWLETVYRTALGSSYSYGICYVLEIPIESESRGS